MMKKNMGRLDQTIRIVVGILLLGLVFVLEGVFKWGAVLGTVLLLTGVVGFCPLYLPFGVDTRNSKKK